MACRLEAVIVGLLFLARLGSRYPGYLAAVVVQFPVVSDGQLIAVADGQLQEQLLPGVVCSHMELEIVGDETLDLAGLHYQKTVPGIQIGSVEN